MRRAKYDLLRLVIEGRIQIRRSVERRQNSWLKDIRRWFNCSSIDIFRAPVSRTMLAIWIANLRQETTKKKYLGIKKHLLSRIRRVPTSFHDITRYNLLLK